METQPNVGPHLTYFKIENFKRFDSFEMSNLGQFNLMVGDNNVGKTSVLEALLFDEDLATMMLNFLGSLQRRNAFGEHNESLNWENLYKTRFWELLFKSHKKSINSTYSNGDVSKELMLQISEFDAFDEDTKRRLREAHPRVPNWWLKLANLTDGGFQLKPAYFDLDVIETDSYLPFVPTSVNYGNELVDWFYKYYNSDKKSRKEFESHLAFFIPNIEETRIHRFGQEQEVLSVMLNNSDNIFPLYQFGEATVKFARLIFEILQTKGKRLMVDEIGSGIHFTRLVDYWKTIIRLCDQYKVQLFATTHSLECQQAFVEALEAPDMVQYQKDARNISLIENKAGEVKAVTYDFAQFEYALTIGFNTRGGKR
jgi:AAA15 family ATPase/GTPase